MMEKYPMFTIDPNAGVAMQVVTLRDMFAMHAPDLSHVNMGHTRPAPEFPGKDATIDTWAEFYQRQGEWQIQQIAKWRYAYADAMVAEAQNNKDSK